MRKAIVVLTVLAACSGGGDGWEDSQREEFIAGCESSGSSAADCKCLQEKIEEAYPDLTDPADLDQDEVTDFARECVG